MALFLDPPRLMGRRPENPPPTVCSMSARRSTAVPGFFHQAMRASMTRCSTPGANMCKEHHVPRNLQLLHLNLQSAQHHDLCTVDFGSKSKLMCTLEVDCTLEVQVDCTLEVQVDLAWHRGILSSGFLGPQHSSHLEARSSETSAVPTQKEPEGA